MTLEEKLEKFKTSAIDNATKNCLLMIENYEQTAKSDFEEYKSQAQEKYKNTLKVKSQDIIKKKNQNLTKEKLEAKRLVNNKSLEIKNDLFSEITKKLQEYKKTPDYLNTLISEINKVIDFAKQSNFIVYLDPDDYSLKDTLEKETGITLTINEESFDGGIKAIIQDKNILIDESFASKIEEERSKFSL